MSEPAPEVVLVCAAATTGWHQGARRLRAAFERAGARTALAEAGPPAEVPTLMLTDFVQAGAARRLAIRLADDAPAIVYCSITAALLWPRPGAIWLDALAADNRPGRHGLWQRRLERRRLRQAPLVLAWDPAALDALGAAAHPTTITVPPPVMPSGPPAPARDIEVVVYGADPAKRRLSYVLDAWRRVRRERERLIVVGRDGRDEPGIAYAGRLDQGAYRALLRRARVFAAAPRREDFGIAALEALADGAMLVTTPAPGSYPALAHARELDPRLVSQDIAVALRHALDDPLPGYQERAAELIAPYGIARVSATLSERVLPRLLAGWKP